MLYLIWKFRVVMMPTLSPLAAPQVVVMTTCGTAKGDKVGIMGIRVIWNLANEASVWGAFREFNAWGYLYQHRLTLILVWISNFIQRKVLHEITYPFPNFKDCALKFGIISSHILQCMWLLVQTGIFGLIFMKKLRWAFFQSKYNQFHSGKLI